MAGDPVGDILLVGPGWLGAPAAEFLARSRAGRGKVIAVSRSHRPAPAGCESLQADITRGADDPAFAVLSAPLQAIVVCVAPSTARGDSYAVYPAAARGTASLAAAFGAAEWRQSVAARICAGFASFSPRHGEGHHAAQPRNAWRKVSALHPSPIACRAKARLSGPIRSTAAMPSRRAARSGGKPLPKSFSSAWVAPSIIIAAGRRAA